jgi:hypothetical protein
MSDRKSTEQTTNRDRLVTRPDEQLPTVEDPAGEHAKGFPADPKPEPEARPADDDLGRSA